MVVDVTVQALIRRPLADVAVYAGNPSNAPAWYANIQSAEWRTPPPLDVGSRLDFVATFLGRHLSYTYEVVDLVAEERLVMRTERGPFPMETTYEWSDVGRGGTLMRLRNRGEPSGFSRLAAPLMATAVRRNTKRELKRLKRLLETER